ncbi:MAG: hypothetical protein ACE5OO_05850, partial [Candidatus Bathyarchaeia archaeon]
MREALKGLEFRNFEDIPDFDNKLSEFLNSLDEEVKHFRGWVEEEGALRLRYPAYGYACLDGDEIVAISYYNVPRKNSIYHFIDLLLRPEGAETGAVTKKEYQRRGISSHLEKLKGELMRKKGFKHYWYRSDSDNIAMMKWEEKKGNKPVKRTRKKLFYLINLFDDHPHALRLRILIQLI